MFTDDADFIDIRGSHHHRTEIGKGHQAIFDTIYQGSNVQYSVVSATPVGDNAVLGIIAATPRHPRRATPGREGFQDQRRRGQQRGHRVESAPRFTTRP